MDRKGHFCRDTGRVSQGHLASQGVFRNFMWSYLMCLFCSLYLVGQAKGGQAALRHRQNRQESYPLKLNPLVAPYRAILRWYRCDTPYRAILSQPSQQSPNRVRYPPLVPWLTQTYKCDTQFCNHIARYLCDTPGKQARKSFAILSLKVSRDMKSIAAGPLSSTPLFRGLGVCSGTKQQPKE